MAKEYTKVNRLGDKSYYKDPEMTILHRTDGPAVEYYDGVGSWLVNGKSHRLDGPAVDYSEGGGAWYVNGVFIFELSSEGKLEARMK